MFLVCEPIASGMEHVPFNAAFLRTICFAFPNDIICFYAEDSHSKHVRVLRQRQSFSQRDHALREW